MEKLRSGSVVEGYVLTEMIGAGGFATVYKAQAVSGSGAYGPVVAVKILHPRRAERSEVTRFRDEAKTILALQHQYIIKVHTFKEYDENFLIFMEYVDTDLKRFVLRRPFKLEEILSILKKAAQGLQYAHSRGVVHRDFNPTNVLVSWSLETLRITDFGIAGRSNPLWRNLLPGTPDPKSGTRGYFAPEQYNGHYDERTDIYAFGRTIRSLFYHSNLPLPARMAKIVEIATKTEPEERYQSMTELLFALEMFASEPEPDTWQVQNVLATSTSFSPPKNHSVSRSNQLAERLAQGRDFVIRLANQEYKVDLLRAELSGELVFTLVDRNEVLRTQVLQSAGEVVFEENSHLLVCGATIRVADNRTLVASHFQQPVAERRKSHRVHFSVSGEVVLPGFFRANSVKVTVLNLSKNGARLKVSQALRLDKDYDLQLNLAGKTCQGKFVILSSQEKDGFYFYSIRFTEMSERDARRIEDYVEEISRGVKPQREIY